ncbi:polyhydroxyalkanoic acid system family protein [Novosphingobium sp.]|jgi:hypothetical protein|uniref:polyhydroxyalkanoic acid system family protein n=1 Tax=Novosphingobium sp. TaxID=1874826 RepID=UPI0022CCFEEB|nr:polyhydroxyalkanoic acid system family protein [Novosphingobium sp.]MCZ8018296.1 polyhydroxyalkanoic acid system family protein [Novosphingobium sp.]MCZ8033290.1 polyhydroxyalkanoic acid system family protein [Novosphingobium sp.]MCZ8051745.1 polyhydroxyalkanoic acid system family protein [Novosphingobium sp.]MCZ8060287.1 polyhydroxyalkanoic acid system family protein [Novosphingobium sp.]MCZ8231929.1 polyhydroxyalkanoic acid system family protein [Novosphingobium sp.]
MRIAVPHSLGVEEARRRIRAGSGEVADMVPAFAKVSTAWPTEDRMDLTVGIMGKALTGQIEVGESEVAFSFEIPESLAFVEPLIRGQVEAKGRKLLG